MPWDGRKDIPDPRAPSEITWSTHAQRSEQHHNDPAEVLPSRRRPNTLADLERAISQALHAQKVFRSLVVDPDMIVT
jgi:hypothetical protein